MMKHCFDICESKCDVLQGSQSEGDVLRSEAV